MSSISIHSKVFPIQSYFDNTLLETARRPQPMNDPIAEKKSEPRGGGRFVGLHPASETPVAFRINTSAERSQRVSPAFVLVPGQHMKVEKMDGFDWGLPNGWMGGGVAQLYVADDEEAFAGWSATKNEILIHRVRLQVQGDAAPAGLTFRKAWPNRFPWPSSLPNLAVEPTRTTLRLRLNSLAAAADMRLLFKAMNDFDADSTGITIGTTDITYVDVTFPGALTSGLAVGYPVVEITPPRMGGDVSTLALVDISTPGGSGDLTDEYVDIVRYGRL